MPDRDRDLTGLFVRDLDSIELPARGAWRPAPRRESALMKASRYLLTAAAVAALLVLALVASFTLRETNPVAAPQTASASASATPASTQTATASASSSAAATTA